MAQVPRALGDSLTHAPGMADSTPDRCPTCGTDVPEGATRCVSCGRALGDANRCPHCRAFAPVVARQGGYACAACGRPREKLEGTEVAGGSTPSPALARRGASLALRGAGMFVLGGGMLAAIVAAMFIPGAAGWAVAIGLGTLGAVAGGLIMRRGARGGREGERAERELALMELARKKGGVLSATDVAKRFQITTAEADALLTSFADGSRVTVEFDDQGLVTYHFRESRVPDAPRVRVETRDEAEVEVPTASDEAKRASAR